MNEYMEEDEDYTYKTDKRDWKPAKYISYETMALCSTKLNPTIRPCGFRTDGKSRTIKSTCMIARTKRLTMLRESRPKLAVCITMYNENEDELRMTISGVLQNYNVMWKDPDIKMRQHDLVVVLVCDGFDKIPESFKKYATDNSFFDVDVLKEKGFMKEEREGQWTMKTMQELMDKNVKDKDIPKNILHMF